MKPVAKAVVETGIVDSDFVKEAKRWGAPIQDPGTGESPKVLPELKGNRDAQVAHIREALEGEGHVRIDECDLDLLRMYLDSSHQKEGRLVLKEGKNHSTKKVSFCITPMGEYAIPWTDRDTDPAILYNGETHLKWEDSEGKQHDVWFEGARSVMFGDQQAFVVCEVKNV